MCRRFTRLAGIQQHHLDQRGLERIELQRFLNTIAYQLGRAEQIDKSINEKRFVVRNALAAHSNEKPVLLIVDSIDTAERDIHEFIIGLPQGVKVLLTARENVKQTYRDGLGELAAIQLSGLEQTDALEFFSKKCTDVCKHATSRKTGKAGAAAAAIA